MPTSRRSWQRQLTAAWTSLRKTATPGSLAILGMGQELRGDDAAGVLVVRRLTDRLHPRPDVLLIDAGPAPEAFTGPLRRFQPGLVLIVDAARMGETPGAIRWLDWEETLGFPGSTHTLPPHILAGFLTAETGCRVALLGIEPVSLEMGGPVSPPVDRSINKIVNILADLLKSIPT